MIQGLFRELNSKISKEWDEVSQQVVNAGENDNLTDEMKTESILRQLTYSSVTLVAVLLDSRQGSSFHLFYDHAPHLSPWRSKSSWKIEKRHPKPKNAKNANRHLEFARLDDEARKEGPPICDFILSNPSVLEPILLFCNSCIRVRDTRSVNTTVRVLRMLLPRFKAPSPIRDYFCNEILKNAIISLHEPYFVDCQKDLASLIAGIIHLDDDIPRGIILSLPGMGDTARVERKLAKLRAVSRSDDRQQRSIVLDLLSSVRGVSIHEQGKMERAKPKRKTAFQEQYMSVETPAAIVRGTSPGLDGVAGMFDA